ncbi:hypothetical protein COUCH_09735 [Couchioplanes caeruleus]|uniref:hypothetical protein n=1 Tax=Couchioplanes caeruleus TaxID=56438 RepID=UPI0020BE8E53|nr:hypothetical protein [Couchioplanes caeruleus]UQU66515.1 hypothetical protein COUCH_09735 [Couchioplanes caeruleus]
MNENDLREALRATMTAARTPPPMESAAAVAAGRRAVHRRAWTGAGATAAVVAAVLVAGPLIAGGDGGSRSGGGPVQAGGPPRPMPTASAPATVTGAPSDAGAETKPSWPLDGDGRPQEDATARSGERYEKGRQLLDVLLTVVPEGYTKPEGTARDGIPLRDHQAAVEDHNSWGYLASAAVADGTGTGRLLAEVHTRGNGLPAGPCELAAEFWGLGGDCHVVRVGRARVGVATPSGSDTRISQWAAYRHPDGIVVYVAQSRTATNAEPGLAPLKKLPLSGPDLAKLAVDPRFHLS